MKTLAAMGLVALLLGAYGLVDRLDCDTEDRLSYRKFVADSCIPSRAGESAVATSDGKRLRCTLYTNTGYGRAPVVISAAVMEMPL